ncbi:MAG: nucleotide exchange factor GrpE, partial [Candidatus Bathyarchaeia archaeon]
MEKSSEQKEDSEELKRLEDALSAEQAKCKEYLDRLKYLQADFENYRKRVEKELVEVAQRSNEKLIVNLLNVMDDLERAIETGKKTKNVKALLEGVGMVYKNLQTMLEQEGLKRIDAVGKPFDPLAHEILVKIPTKDQEEGTVIEE